MMALSKEYVVRCEVGHAVQKAGWKASNRTLAPGVQLAAATGPAPVFNKDAA
jgi:hypothetical protein